MQKSGLSHPYDWSSVRLKLSPKKPLIRRPSRAVIGHCSSLKQLAHTSDRLQPLLAQKKKHSTLKLLPNNSQRHLNFVRTNRLESHSHSLKPAFPMAASAALTQFRRQLSHFEREEILSVPQVYYVGVGPRAAQFFHDEDGNYNLHAGDHLAYRYEALGLLGNGTFGQVWKAFDHKAQETVAIKVLKNKKLFAEQGQVELQVLETLNEWDTQNNHHIVELKHSFMFRDHLCLVFELLGKSLYDWQQARRLHNLPVASVKAIAKQTLRALQFIRRHRVIHCDLKPENILIVHRTKPEIKLIDFGSSCFVGKQVYSYIQSRFYRAPEIILGLGYGTAIDMWSLGCMLYELYYGYPLFPGVDETDQLVKIMEVKGLPPPDLLSKARKASKFFADPCTLQPELELTPRNLKTELKHDADFFDFLMKCLHWVPARRLTPAEALEHQWLHQSK